MNVGFTIYSIKSLIITISHIYALVLALWLMSHSLISIPKLLFSNSFKNSKNLFGKYVQLPKISEAYQDAKFNLKEISIKVLSLNNLKDSNLEFRDWMISLLEKVPPEYESSARIYRGNEDYIITEEQLSNEFMSKLTKKFNDDLYKFNSIRAKYMSSINEILDLEDIINSKHTKELVFRRRLTSKKSPKFNYYLYVLIRPAYDKFFALLLFSLSIVIIESEILHSTKFSIIRLFVSIDNLRFLKSFLTLIVVLTYMLLSAMNSLSNIKIFNIYHISQHQSSDPVSLTFFITYAARLTIPLSYNFIMLLGNNTNAHTMFKQFLGKSLNLIKIGQILNDWLPRLIFIPILLSSLNIYDIVKTWVLNKFEFFEDYYEYLDDLEFEDENNNNTAGNNIARNNALVQEAKNIISRELANNNELRSLNIQAHNGVDLEEDNNFEAYNGISSWFSRIVPNLMNIFGGNRRNTSSSFMQTSFEEDNSLLRDDVIDGRVNESRNRNINNVIV
ncbi:hypothetical protein PACTADRAFT_49166 [Pachysolen tannophilus NRRL Y-2460]|uniref:Uncharacterized protein n=1 Tax=Pachysolen tannophilus NRRL Y-2460 TaxID=669874 RepID=A0A1E4U0D3_PACTA|nr:hypothetical protein PACTADRAFT_49166 [Pachysolen tannophilus NRRL Y-2460]